MSKETEKKEASSAKKPEAASEVSAAKGKGNSQIAGNCFSWGCKKSSDKFNFCHEHFDHFKFGLIKKTGEPVSDFEKKFEHYKLLVAKRSARQVA